MIPCETIVRLSNILPRPGVEIDPIFFCLRIDNGLVIATDRKFMAIECVGGNAGVVHLLPSPALIAQCKTEAPFGSKLDIDATTGRISTTLGYAEIVTTLHAPGGDFNRWREVVKQATPAPTKGSGGMFWSGEDVARLVASSPSGQVIFQESIDARRPTLIRDVNDPNWLGVFRPNRSDGVMQSPASVPGWLVLP